MRLSHTGAYLGFFHGRGVNGEQGPPAAGENFGPDLDFKNPPDAISQYRFLLKDDFDPVRLSSF